MSKADNLTEFLAGVADKLRALLGETARMSPQAFEEKIQEVYDRGAANGGPAADKITATAKDVRKGKVFGSGGPGTLTGTMKVTGPDYLASSGSGAGHKLTGAVLYSDYTGEEMAGKKCLYMQADNESYLDNVRYYMAEAETVAEAIKLTADKLVSGQTVLGVSGKAVPMVMASFEINYAGGSTNPAATGCAAYGATKSGTGYVTLPAGTYRVVGHASYDSTEGIGLWVAKQGALGTALKSGTKLDYVQECAIDATLTLSAATTVTVVAHSDTAGHGRRGAVTITKTA